MTKHQIRTICASNIPSVAPPWPHYPHCHTRIAADAPAATGRAGGSLAADRHLGEEIESCVVAILMLARICDIAAMLSGGAQRATASGNVHDARGGGPSRAGRRRIKAEHRGRKNRRRENRMPRGRPQPFISFPDT